MGSTVGLDAELLAARLEDAVARCESGRIAQLPFLTPRAQKQAERALRTRGFWQQAWFWGGYPTAERATLFLLPDYLAGLLSAEPSVCPASEVCALLEEELAASVCSLLICGSGFRTLTHRDFLGAVLGLGLERDAIGDIAVQDAHRAVLFCGAVPARFLKEHLVKVASDSVRCEDYTMTENFQDGRQYRTICDTVASARLDCAVAALCRLSREDAQAAIRSGMVELDFEPEEHVDAPLSAPATISVRGYGRFILRAFDGETRKGRLRMRADQLI